MVTQNTNPFILPGFGQDGDMATNPVLASMEMMRKAWEGLATAGGFDPSQMVPGTSPDDIERRISDLRAVENWLRMNLSMLSSTIQALEVQRSTLATLQAFVASAGGGSKQAASTASPLDVALGIRRGADVAPSADTSGLFGGRAAAKASPDSASSGDPANQTPAKESTPEAGSDDATDAAGAMMKSWWDMLQSQFDNLASATAAGMHSAEALQEAAAEVQKKAVESTQATAEALQKSASTVVQATKTATAKKAAAKQAPARTSAAKKSATKQPAAKKSAAKKTTAKKTAAASKKSSSATRGAARKS